MRERPDRTSWSGSKCIEDILAGAMDEVDWLKSRLEHLETTIVSQGLGSRGEPQGRPMSRRGRLENGSSVSDASDQVSARD